jgi:hypothetical protein
MGNFVCTICEKEFTNYSGLFRHQSLIHKKSAEDYCIEMKYNGIRPTCECGCGEYTGFISVTKGFSRFIQSHHNRIPGKNNFHKNPESKIKSAKTQSENWKKGMYRRWWEEDTEETKQKIEGIKEKLRNNKERGEKISISNKGRVVTDLSRKKISESQIKRFNDNPELRKIMSHYSLERLRTNCKLKTSKLEDLFIVFLGKIGLIKDVDYIHNHLIYEIKTFFDFYLPKHNIIIEVDGDFYHCNPNTIHRDAKYPIQLKNQKNDKRKNTWCETHNIKLIRFWEKDINERPEWVIEELKKHLSI